MDEARLVEALRIAAAGSKDRSQTARLRHVFPDVERTIDAGLSRKGLLSVLTEHGFCFTYRSLGMAIYRIRKSQSKTGKSAPTPTEGHPFSSPVPHASSPVPAPVRHPITNPAELAKARRRDINLKDYKT